jgi:hypothetical protein
MGQAGINGVGSFYATRALLGLIEGGFIADTILYLSYFYTSGELTIRLSYFWVAYTITNIIGALLAAGILEMRHHTHLEGWRWLFALEGAFTFLIGLFALFYLPASPTQTHRSLWGRIRGKGWFTEHEETIIVNKVIRDDPTKSDSELTCTPALADLQCTTERACLSMSCGTLSWTTTSGLCILSVSPPTSVLAVSVPTSLSPCALSATQLCKPISSLFRVVFSASLAS